MKRFLLLICLICSISFVYADENNYEVYSFDKKFGLKQAGVEITKPEYNKMIRLGDNAWIVQKRHKYGLIDNSGKIIIPIKYRWADRVASDLVKFGNDNDYGIYNDKGEIVVPPEYSLIERISEHYFLTCKNYKYGMVDLAGNIVLQNIFDTIYTPDRKSLILQYQGEWYKLDIVQTEKVEFTVEKMKDDDETIGEVMVRTGAVSGYSVLTFTDYVLKLFSSLSPAYEATIDELMFEKGGDAVSVIMNFSWLPKMPFTYLKNYYKNIRKHENDVLSHPRNFLRKRM